MAGVSVRYFSVFAIVRPGHPIRLLLCIACKSVDFGGLNSVACRYCMSTLIG